MWQGEGKALDVINDGKNDKLQLAEKGKYTGQFWRLKYWKGFYRLTCKWLG